METLHLKVLQMLKKECNYASSISMYMKHIVVQLDSSIPTGHEILKEKVITLIGQYFPEREENLAFIITGGGLKDEDFWVERKTTVKEVLIQVY